MPNEVIQSILTRRSIRAYTPQPVTDEQLDTLLTAARYAPSGMNQQPWHFVALRGRESIQKMLDAGGVEGDPYYGASTVIIAFADQNAIAPQACGGLALENVMLAAHALGLGSCWIHAATRIFPTPGGKALQAQWGVPEHYQAVGSVAVGYPGGPLPDPKPRKEGCVTLV